MNIDENQAQLTMADCLYLTSTQQEIAGFKAATQSFLSALDPAVAISFNPNLDYYVDSTVPMVDSQDAVYCINYVLKRWRFVYNSSLTCSHAGAVVSVDIAGGKVGDTMPPMTLSPVHVAALGCSLQDALRDVLLSQHKNYIV